MKDLGAGVGSEKGGQGAGLGFAIPAALLAISLLGESTPLTSCSVHVAICPEDEREEGEPMRDWL